MRLFFSFVLVQKSFLNHHFFIYIYVFFLPYHHSSSFLIGGPVQFSSVQLIFEPGRVKRCWILSTTLVDVLHSQCKEKESLEGGTAATKESLQGGKLC